MQSTHFSTSGKNSSPEKGKTVPSFCLPINFAEADSFAGLLIETQEPLQLLLLRVPLDSNLRKFLFPFFGMKLAALAVAVGFFFGDGLKRFFLSHRNFFSLSGK